MADARGLDPLIDPLKARVTFRAPLAGHSGYGQMAHTLLRHFRNYGYRVEAIPCGDIASPWAAFPPDLAEMVTLKSDNKAEIFAHPPGVPMRADTGAFRPEGGKTVWLTMWETTRITPSMVAELNKATCVVNPSEWGANCFNASGVDVPIRVVPLGIDPQTYFYAPPRPHDVCVFGAAGRFAHGGERKGLNEVVELFQTAFPDETDVQLRLKVFSDCKVPDVEDNRIEIVRAYLTEDEMRQFYWDCTAFVSAAKCEGWGLHQHQALACGRPLVSVRYGGLYEFFDSNVGYVVEHKLERATGYYASTNGLWAEPVKESFVRQMRRVYNDREEAANKGTAAAKRAREFTWNRTSKALLEVAKEFGIVP
jgi:glycosyltransferase involved in cell wall biosynthesis